MVSPRHPANASLVISFLVSLLVPSICEAQRATDSRRKPGQTERAPAKEDDHVLLTYDVRDLVLHVPDYPYPAGNASVFPRSAYGGGTTSGGGFGGGGMPGIRQAPAGDAGRISPVSDTIRIEDLTQAVQSVVAPGSWSHQGGQGQVQQLGTSLVVWQTRAVHQQIENLLQQLRDETGERKTVAVDARWFLLDSDDLDRLMPPAQNGVRGIDRQVLAEFTRRPTSIRGYMNCFSGQLVYLVSGTRQNVVSSYIPVVGSIDRRHPDDQVVSLAGGGRMRFVSNAASQLTGTQPGVGYQPIVEKPNLGALLEIRPTLIRGRESAIVDLKSTLTVLGRQADHGRDRLESPPAPPAVDRIAIETQELATTLRVPLQQPVLVGGLTYVPPSMTSIRDKNDVNAVAAEKGSAENRQLYLMLELR